MFLLVLALTLFTVAQVCQLFFRGESQLLIHTSEYYRIYRIKAYIADLVSCIALVLLVISFYILNSIPTLWYVTLLVLFSSFVILYISIVSKLIKTHIAIKRGILTHSDYIKLTIK